MSNPITSTVSTLQPSVLVTREKEGIYDVVVDAMAPNSCYVSEGYELALPPGVDLAIPEYEHLVCKLKYTGGIDRFCLTYLKPFRWEAQDLNLGTGKSHLVVHIVVNETVLAGSAIAKLPSTTENSAWSGDDPVPWPFRWVKPMA